MNRRRLPLVVLISGSGSNLQAIIDAIQGDGLPAKIMAVISNRPEAYGLERARHAGISTEVIEHTRYPDREAFDAVLRERIDRYRPELVVLAGFMRILTPKLVAHYPGHMLNIHPALLPAFRGLHTHRRALAAGIKEHGASVHFVTEKLDSGPVIIQAKISVLSDDTPETLASRVLAQEHKIYPQAIRWFAEGRLRMVDETVYFDGKPLQEPLSLP
jgi:phosphoribosylglycinamide formyltransferase-1